MGFECANYTGERLTCSLLTDWNMHMLTATFSVGTIKTRCINLSKASKPANDIQGEGQSPCCDEDIFEWRTCGG